MNSRIEAVTVYYVKTIDRGRVGPIHHLGIAKSIADAEDRRAMDWQRAVTEAVLAACIDTEREAAE